jgi:hypothetical protein
MAKAEATVEELVSKIERGELRLPLMQRVCLALHPRARSSIRSIAAIPPAPS